FRNSEAGAAEFAIAHVRRPLGGEAQCSGRYLYTEGASGKAPSSTFASAYTVCAEPSEASRPAIGRSLCVVALPIIRMKSVLYARVHNDLRARGIAVCVQRSAETLDALKRNAVVEFSVETKHGSAHGRSGVQRPRALLLRAPASRRRAYDAAIPSNARLDVGEMRRRHPHNRAAPAEAGDADVAIGEGLRADPIDGAAGVAHDLLVVGGRDDRADFIEARHRCRIDRKST